MHESVDDFAGSLKDVWVHLGFVRSYRVSLMHFGLGGYALCMFNA